MFQVIKIYARERERVSVRVCVCYMNGNLRESCGYTGKGTQAS